MGADILASDGRTFQQIIDAAEALLATAGGDITTLKSSNQSLRTAQGTIKNLIDAINNASAGTAGLTVVPFDLTGSIGAFARCGDPALMFAQQ